MTTPNPSEARVAVIMPIRNYAAPAMRRCIQSLRRQVPSPEVLDILLADYGSTPAEAAAAKTLADECGARYAWFDAKGPWNRSRAINLGVKATEAPVVFTSDADLVFAPNFCATIFDLAERFRGQDLYAHAPMMDLPQNLAVDLDDYEADYQRLLTVAKERVWSKGNVVFSRSLFERMRGWEEAYCIWGCEDNDFFDRAHRSGATLCDLKGTTSFLHHWHPSNKRGRDAAAQVARNQIMFWPVEKRIPVQRPGPLAAEPSLPEDVPFRTPTVSIIVTGAEDPAKTTATVASIAAQSFRDLQVVLVDTPQGKATVQDADGAEVTTFALPTKANDAVSHCLQRATADVVGLMQAGETFVNDDALTWRVLIPLLKGETPQMSFMWRRPSFYTPQRQIVDQASASPTPAPARPASRPAAPFGNYASTTTHAMSEPIKAAMLFSRAPIETAEDLGDALGAEKKIAEMGDADFGALNAQRAENPGDLYFDFWTGLVHASRGDDKSAHGMFVAAIGAGLPQARVIQALEQLKRPVPPPSTVSARPASRRESCGVISRAEAATRLTPHFVSLVQLPDSVPVVRLTPDHLVDARRFDILLKYLYAHAGRLGIKSDFFRRAYLAHIAVFNGFNEGDGTKSGSESFVASFDRLIASVSRGGFDPSISAVPIDRHGVAMDGAHRVAACLAYDKPVTCLQLPADGAVYDYKYFRGRQKFVAGGLETKYADAAALAHVRLKTNTHVVSLFPAADSANDDKVVAILERYARIVYGKAVQIDRAAAPLLMRQVYEREAWLGDWSNNFKGAQNKGARCFAGEGPLRAFLIETDTPARLRACKEEIRALYASGQDAVHINDTHEETKVLAKIYFNDNSIAFLNSAAPQSFGPFNEQFARYREVLKNGGYDTDQFCIEGSAIMAAYGIRSSRDLDYLSFNDQAPDFGTKLIGNHASELRHHVLGRDEIVFDPANHFYFFGMKIATLDVLKGMKTKRGEKPKDIDDVAMIDRWTAKHSVPGVAPVSAQAKDSQPTGWMAHRDRYEDIRRLLGGKAAVIVDGGANVGAVTAKFREQYPDAVVHAFEPIPHALAVLRQKFNSDARVKIHATALGERRARATFKITNNTVSSSLFTPASRLQKYHGDKVAVRQEIEVDVMPLHEAVSALIIDLIKLDVQGGELAALKGCGADLLQRTKVIVLETMFAEVYEGQPLFADVDAFLRSQRFRLYNLYDLYTHEDGQLLQGDAVYVNTAFFA